ncbi:MAG TPA: UDP-N-acetylglucosamine 2-epimerase (non-hydrolyzing) [Acidothermaceae bacterium]|jgi:UDP-N-acetylglucosamine 2-epimerase (non-hydrolysing)
MRLTVPIGTRPEIVKLAQVIAALRAAGHDVRCIATGQHTDAKLAADMFVELGCPPDVSWQLPQGEGARVGALLAAAYDEFAERQPDAVLVLGDTYTAPLLAIAARRHGVGVIHLEAGLRSFNGRSVEETNRTMMVALATLHLAPTDLAADMLRDEGVASERIRVVGNPVIDAIAATDVSRVALADRTGVLFTAHRATNVDDPARLAQLVAVVRRLGEHYGPVTFPLHPRTRARLEAAGLLAVVAALPNVDLVDPMPYGALLSRLASARVVVTDSGGLQEESSWFGVPSVVLRATTPRWEGVLDGSAVLCGLDEDEVMHHVGQLTVLDEQMRIAALPCPYGDGQTAQRVVDVLADNTIMTLIAPREPSVGDPLPARVAARSTVSPTESPGLTQPEEPIEAVTVDLDDTVFAQADWLLGAWRDVARAGADIGLDHDTFLAALMSVAAEGSDHGGIIDRALRSIDVGEHELAAIVPGLVAVFSTHSPTTLAPYPGFHDALAAVRANVPVACVTDGNPRIQRAKLRSLGLTDAFDVVIYSDELGREFRKPHSAPFERALRELGVPAARAVHIGDRPGKDVAGAVNAGMRAVRVHTGEYSTIADPADATPWRSFADVTAALRSIAACTSPAVGKA